jgi:hypothetical protein
MVDQQRRGGLIFLKVDGRRYQAKGSFTCNLGVPKREAIVGTDGVHGYKEIPQPCYIEGEITDHQDLRLVDLATVQNATVTLELATGKSVVLRNAWFAGGGDLQTEEGNIGVRFEGMSAEEV